MDPAIPPARSRKGDRMFIKRKYNSLRIIKARQLRSRRAWTDGFRLYVSQTEVVKALACHTVTHVDCVLGRPDCATYTNNDYAGGITYLYARDRLRTALRERLNNGWTWDREPLEQYLTNVMGEAA
jgi:hypothetical protein